MQEKHNVNMFPKFIDRKPNETVFLIKKKKLTKLIAWTSLGFIKSTYAKFGQLKVKKLK